MSLRGTLAIVAVAFAAPIFAAEVYTIDTVHSEADFKIRHMMASVSGSFTDFSGTISIDRLNPSASSVEFTIKAASIDTKEPKRDKHLRSADFFDAEQFPTITFKSTRVTPAGKDLYNVTGLFTMHGVTKSITLPVKFLGFARDSWGNDVAGFEVETVIDRKDYGIVWNKALDYGGLYLGDEVNVSMSIEAARKK